MIPVAIYLAACIITMNIIMTKDETYCNFHNVMSTTNTYL